MLFIRIAVFLVALAAGGSLVVYVITGNARYHRFAWHVFKYALIAVLALLGLLFSERVARML